MGRGRLRVYLGAAPGVGKTAAMLAEGHRRAARGTDVVVGLVETHGRRGTAELVGDLPLVARRTDLDPLGDGVLDVDALLARRPQVALVDELAHTNPRGARHEHRWQDVEDLLTAGIDVVTTVNVQHLESLHDVVETITGVAEPDRVPDHVVRAADEVELVDMSPTALRRRLAHGNVYPAERVDAALANTFRLGNLTALRELALLWTAGTVDEALQGYRRAHDIGATWETHERVVVALSGGPEGDALLRRAARIAARSAGGDLLAVHVLRHDGVDGAGGADLARQRALVEGLGGSYHQLVGADVPEALLAFARAENATQVVLGASRRSRLAALLGGPGTGSAVVRDAGEVDVHLVTHGQTGRGRRLPDARGSLSRRRQVNGCVLAVLLPVVLTAALTAERSRLNLVSDVLVFLLAVVVVALVGGLLPAVLAAVAASLLLNYYFAQPLHTLTVTDTNDALALVVFLLVAALVSAVVDLAARRTRQAARATAESQTLGALASSVLRGETAVPALLERVRESFGLTCVTLLERTAATGWRVVGTAGRGVLARPQDADADFAAGPSLVLAVAGRPLRAEDQRVVGAFAAHAAALLERARLAEQVAAAVPLAAGDRMRTALLAAVGHDLRTPLASAKAAVTSLRGTDVTWTEHDRGELLLTADESLDRLARLVDDLLDMSRLVAGAMPVLRRPVALDEVVPLALDDVGPAARAVVVDVPDDLPEVQADAALVARVVANLVANAVRFSPADRPPSLTGSSVGAVVELRVVDRGPGIPADQLERVFVPFQRLGDNDTTTGVGLGLALSRGLAEAMDGTLLPEDTPGGGLTMVLQLPVAHPGDAG